MTDLLSGPPASLVPRVRALVPSMIPSHARVAEVLLADPAAVVHMTVSDLAEAAGTSSSTVVRYCQELGFRGFYDLKIAMAKEAVPSAAQVHMDATAEDSPQEVLRKVLAASAEALRDAVSTVDPVAFERALAALVRAGRVLVVGVGTSFPLAQDAAYRLVMIGVRAEAYPDPQMAHVTASSLTGADLCVAVSHTGLSRETLACVESAKSAGASTVAVTSFARSPLAELVDVALVAGSRETTFRLEAMASRLAHIGVLDALFVAAAFATSDRANRSLSATADVLSSHHL